MAELTAPQLGQSEGPQVRHPKRALQIFQELRTGPNAVCSWRSS